jgi:hypothetical protein
LCTRFVLTATGRSFFVRKKSTHDPVGSLSVYLYLSPVALLAMNGVGASQVKSQSLLSTASPADLSGAGSTSPPSQHSSDSTSPNSTQNLTNSTPNDSTDEANTTQEPNGTIGYPLGGKNDSQEIAHDKGRQPESASEGGEPQPSTESVKAEATGLESVNVQIELLEHTPDVVVDDGQDWAPDGDHEMKRVKVSAFTSTSLCLMHRKWLKIAYIHLLSYLSRSSSKNYAYRRIGLRTNWREMGGPRHRILLRPVPGGNRRSSSNSSLRTKL